MEALPKLYLLHPTIQVLNAANSENLKIKSFEKLAHSESETDDCGLLRNMFCIFTKLVVCWPTVSLCQFRQHTCHFKLYFRLLSWHFQLINFISDFSSWIFNWSSFLQMSTAKIFFVFSKIFSFLVWIDLPIQTCGRLEKHSWKSFRTSHQNIKNTFVIAVPGWH